MLDPDDPLITAPDPQSWLGLDGEDAPPTLDALFERMQDYHAFHQLVLPAFAPDGAVLLPPQDHVLDHLVRALDLVDGQEAILRPSADTVAVVYDLPECDRCRRRSLARYDALVPDRGWMNVCIACFRDGGGTSLGSGLGQYLLTTAEVTDPVRAVVDVLTSRLGRDSYWADEPDEPSWVRAYRACGFGGPDENGRMARELYGKSIWAHADSPGVIQIDRASDADEIIIPFDGPPGDYRVPQEWAPEEVRHFLRSTYGPQTSRHTVPYSRIDEPLEVSEARTAANLDAQHLPQLLHHGIATQPVRPLRLPLANALARSDAKRCARDSADPVLIGRLVRECPLYDVQVAAVLNRGCPDEVLLDCCTGAVPGLRHRMPERTDLSAEMLEILTRAAIEGPSSHQHDRWFITSVLLHPGCPEDALPVLIDRIKAAPTPERIHLAAHSRPLPLKRRQTIATHLLSDARRSKVASAIIDALICVDQTGTAAHGPILPDEDMLDWLVQHPHRTIQRLSRDRVRELGLQSAFLV